MVSKELIVLITDRGQGYVIKRRTKEKFENDNIKELAKTLYAAAPEEHACAVYACCSPNYQKIEDIVDALHVVGYTDVKTVNQTALKFGQLAEASHLQLRVNDCVAFDTTNNFTYYVYQRSSSGFTFIGDSEEIQSGVVVKSKEIKNVIVANGNELSNYDREDYSQCFPKKNVYFDCDNETFAIEDIWRLYEQGDYKFPVPLDIHIRLRYRNMIHLVDAKNDELPFQTTFELDVEDADTIEVAVAYNNSSFDQCKYIVLEHDGSKNKKIEVAVDVPQTFLPVVTAKFVSETDKPDYSVYLIDYNDETKMFTGTHITAESTDEIISECTDEAEVISALSAYNPSTKLRGVLINYRNSLMFPVEIHRKIIEALPLSTRVIVGPTQTDFSIHLKNAKVDVETDDIVAISNHINDFPKIYYFKKTDDGFEPHGQGDVLMAECKALVIILNDEPSSEDKKRMVTSSNAKLFCSVLSTMPENILNEYAWDFFNGKNFGGYMVRPYLGVNISARSNDYLTAYMWTDSYGCTSQRRAILDVKHDFDSSSFIYAKRDYLKAGYFTVTPFIFFHYIGFREAFNDRRQTKCPFEVINVSFDSNLCPAIEIRETKSLLSLMEPFSVEPIPFVVPIYKPSYPFWVVILDGGDQQYVSTTSEGQTIMSIFNDIKSVVDAIKQLTDVVTIQQIVDISSHDDIAERKFRDTLLYDNFGDWYKSVPLRKFVISVMLAQYKVKVAVGQTVVIFSTFERHLFLKKCENEYKAVFYTIDNNIRPLFSKYNVKLVIFDNLPPATVRIHKKKFVPIKCIENLGAFDKRKPLSVNMVNDYISGKYDIADYDILTYSLTINGGKKQILHDGVVNFPFHKQFYVKMDGVTSVSVDVTPITVDVDCRKYDKNLLTCDTTNCESKLYMFDVTQNDHYFMLANGYPLLPTANIDDSELIFSKDGIVKPKVEEPVKLEKGCTLGLLFTQNNEIFVTGVVTGVGSINIDPVPAYFYLVKTEDGGVKTQVGAEAKNALETDKKFVIYDFPELLAADTDPDEEDPTWTFETTRTDDGSLLVHLSDDDVTSPLTLFASVVKSVILYAQKDMKHDIRHVGVWVPTDDLISDENWEKISDAIGVQIRSITKTLLSNND